jgi:hypothetical protein
VAEAFGDFQNANAWLAHVYEDAYNTLYEGWRIIDECIVVEEMLLGLYNTPPFLLLT